MGIVLKADSVTFPKTMCIIPGSSRERCPTASTAHSTVLMTVGSGFSAGLGEALATTCTRANTHTHTHTAPWICLSMLVYIRELIFPSPHPPPFFVGWCCLGSHIFATFIQLLSLSHATNCEYSTFLLIPLIFLFLRVRYLLFIT